MKDIQIRQIFRNTAEYAEQEVVVRGWIRTNRGSNKFGFIELNDGTFFKSIQVVYEKEIIDNFQEISKAPISAALMVRGTLALTPEAKQPFEIKAKEIVIEADSDADYPLQKKRHSMEFLRETSPYACNTVFLSTPDIVDGMAYDVYANDVKYGETNYTAGVSSTAVVSAE